MPMSAARLCAAAVSALLMLVGVASPASAADGSSAVRSIVVESTQGTMVSTVRLDFDKPVSSQQAATLKASLAATPPVTTAAAGESMWCLGSIGVGDANSFFTIQYSCGSRRRLAWSWKLSAALRAIIVSPVSERGLEWWRNGAFAGQNAPHSAPKDYTFHGNMNPVYAGNDIDYQDYATFRHNVGPGGTGSVIWSGSVILEN